MPEEWVTIEHKQLTDAPPVAVTRKAYERVWKEKGFTIVEPDETEKGSTTVDPEAEEGKEAI